VPRSWDSSRRFLSPQTARQGSIVAPSRPTNHRPQARFGVVPKDDVTFVTFVQAADAARAFLQYFQTVISSLWRLGRRYWLDALIVAAGVLAAVEVATRNNESATQHLQASAWWAAPWAFAFGLPLLLRRRFPFAAPAAVFLLGAVTSFANGTVVTYAFGNFLAVIAASFLFGMLFDRTQSPAGLGIALGAGAIVVNNDPRQALGDYWGVAVVFTIAWLAGLALGSKLKEAAASHERAERAERERERLAEEAVAEERARIARELHDVVAHSMSVMVVQAGGVRRLLHDDQEREREALLVVERIGREALTEMRRMLGVLRASGDGAALTPQPGLEHLDLLIEQVRRSGLNVAVQVTGEPVPLPTGLGLSAYRIVQESLTNALKHGDRSSAQVRLNYGEDELEVEVIDGSTIVSGERNGGHGLVGMRERVAVYGGELEAGPREGGGYRVRARLPLSGTHA
jgi:signal transduction histidine kinase